MPGQQAVDNRPGVRRLVQDDAVPENGDLKLAVRFQAGDDFRDGLGPGLLVHGGHAHPDAGQGGAGLAQHAGFLEEWRGHKRGACEEKRG